MPSFGKVSVEEVKAFETLEVDDEEVDEDEEDVPDSASVEAEVIPFKPTIAKRIQKHRANRMRYGNSYVVPLNESEVARLIVQLTSFGYAVDTASDKLGTCITVIGKRVD